PHPLPLWKLKKMSQEKLFDFNPPQSGPGRHERLLQKALDSATESHALADADAGLISLALANAWALDQIEDQGKVSLIGNITGPYREVLEALSLTPTTRNEAANDSFAAALAALADQS
ncbi:hypothetical protein, partial [Corynebacterium diphtheriae]